MRFQIPRLVRPLPLAEYAPELGAVTVFVWVNPPGEFLNRREGLDEVGLYAWIAEMWSQGQDPGTHWTADDVRALVSGDITDTDPGLWRWLMRRTWELIAEHRAQAKKA